MRARGWVFRGKRGSPAALINRGESWHICPVGYASVKGVDLMKQFLRDVLAAVVAGVIVAVVVRLLNL